MERKFEYDAFLSYSSKDETKAKAIWQKLTQSGLRIFWSDQSLKNKLGSSYIKAIQEALTNSKNFIFFASQNSITSEWVETECETFYANYHIPNKKERLFIVLVDQSFKPDQLLPFYRTLQITKSVDDLNSILGPQVVEIIPHIEKEIKTPSPVEEDISPKGISPAIKQDSPVRNNLQKEGLTFFDYKWDLGESVELKLIGTSAKDHHIFKNAAHSSSMNLKISGSIAYLPTSEGIRAFNISDPKLPKLLSLFPAGQSSRKWFELVDHIGFVRGSDASIHVIDYKDPTNPKGVHFENYHRNIFNNCGNGLLIYDKNIMIDLCHEENCGVKVLDFSDTSEISKNVRILGVVKFRTGCGTLYKNYLLLGNSLHPQLRLVRLNKETIDEIKTLPIESLNGGLLPYGIVADKERLYIFGTDLRKNRPVVSVYDLKNFPDELDCVTSFELPSDQTIRTPYGLQVNISGSWLYYNDSGRMFLYDISQPLHPKPVLSADGPFYVACIYGNTMYCGDDRNIWIFEIIKKRAEVITINDNPGNEQLKDKPENKETGIESLRNQDGKETGNIAEDLKKQAGPLIGTPEIISKPFEPDNNNAIKLGNIKIVSLSSNIESENPTRIGTLRINEL